MPRRAICATCDWWVKQDLQFHARTSPSAVSGQCRINPPSALSIDGKVLTRWPLTADTEFCGKHPEFGVEVVPL